MKRNLTTTALLMLFVGALAALTACAKKPPKNAVEAKPASAPTGASVETRVTPPQPAPRQDVVASPIAESIAVLNSKGYLNAAYFDYDKADLRDDARATLAGNADWLKKYPSIQVLIEGHCDERGTSAYNLALGDRRANAAREYLASLGIDATRMKTVSYGKERPGCTESTEACWQKNRRAPFVITAK
ncbi:MAG TPA: peptidoglycan-associated lipoprotein Pal [Thermoanaerobaculia bacterium]|nr:peptidoglycan-associated lipoprotein Pal [Thermoanaerobaculia bacterium]